jgi:hypothetical protein
MAIQEGTGPTEQIQRGAASENVSKPNQEAENIALERYKATLDFWRVVLVSGFFAIVIAVLPPAFQYATAILEDARKAREEALSRVTFHDQYIKDFVNMGLNQDIEIRIRLATYFVNLSDKDYKDGWAKYLKLLRELRGELRAQINDETKELFKLARTGGPDDLPLIRQLGRQLSWASAELGYARPDTDVSVVTSSLAELPKTVAVRAQLKVLTSDAELVRVAKAMQPYLASRPQELQKLVRSIDPQDRRLTGNGGKARQVVNAWIDWDEMTTANQQQWLAAIASASVTSIIASFAKATNKRADVEAIQKDHIASGAISSDLTEDEANWMLTTVWPRD